LKTQSLLCLGDSYTIGEGVALHDSFPYQLIQLLRKNECLCYAPEIVAKTGWTSFELIAHLQQIKLNQQYDFVTLLIGVNNQYRELSTIDFAKDFELLLQQAMNFVAGDSKKIIVLSIPDWGVTPFAKDRNVQQIANEIDSFNGVCELLAQKYQTNFVNITTSTRRAKEDITLLTHDQLHYSDKEHHIWASMICNIICNQLV
jgi:lysophospholipase L1-like esterase